MDTGMLGTVLLGMAGMGVIYIGFSATLRPLLERAGVLRTTGPSPRPKRRTASRSHGSKAAPRKAGRVIWVDFTAR